MSDANEKSPFAVPEPIEDDAAVPPEKAATAHGSDPQTPLEGEPSATPIVRRGNLGKPEVAAERERMRMIARTTEKL